MTKDIEIALSKFKAILTEQLERVETIKQQSEWLDFSSLNPIKIGICYGDGIGESISIEAHRVLDYVLASEVQSGKVIFEVIPGLTIENRLAAKKAIPDDVMAQLKQCHVILKGPTTTPQKGTYSINLESANVSMRKALDLFANVRPVKVSEDNIDWIFFRENTEGEYVLGSKGFEVTPDLAVDFKVVTTPGCERIIRMAFEYAKQNGKTKVTIVTKSNVVKTTDGKFSEIAHEIAKSYPGIRLDEWYIDIMTAKLIDPQRRSEFQVLVMPNLYGDILTDEAAQIQGGVGTAGSANIGMRYAMFEAIHGSAPRMVEEGRAQYADPASIIKAAAMLLRHIGYTDRAEKIEKALEICTQYERKYVITGRPDGATGKAFADYLMSWIENPDLDTQHKLFSGK